MALPKDVPWPKDAPEAGACVRLERPEPGLAVLVLDPPHRKLAVLDLPLMRDLELQLDRLAQDGGLSGLVITGRTPTSFAAGADLDALAEITSAAVATELARYGEALFEKIAKMRARTVAAVGGPVPGGAFELCLACERIVLADHPSTRIGLPETRLGILPAWGGSQRLPRRIGVPKALEAILSGKLYVPQQALKLGLVDRLTWPEYLRRVASEIAMNRMPSRRYDRGPWVWIIDKNPLALTLIHKRASAELEKKTHGHYPAPVEALGLVVNAPRTPLEQGFVRESEALGRLAVSPQCKSLVAIFRLSEDAKKLGRMPDGSEARAIRSAGVVGAGVMGGAIAGLFAESGIDARLSDVARAPIDLALIAHRKRIARDLQRRRLRMPEANQALDKLSTVVGIEGFGRAELALEAVAEKLEIKRSVFAKLAAQMAPDAILATNTSSLSVDAIFDGVSAPERVVGMHFFNPVHAMPLVEIVRGKSTSDATVAATARLALKLGKTPVVVRDVAGFLVNRLLGPYLDEALRILAEDVEIERIDRVARDFGMPMGPLELLDEVGLDIAAHASQSLEAAYGARMAGSPLVAKMLAAGLKGKKGGAGFYFYERGEGGERAEKLGANPDVKNYVERSRNTHVDISDQGLVDQLVLSMVNEAARALEEDVVAGPRELDLATVFGMGFPPFRGGLLRYADARGIKDVVDSLRRIHEAPDVMARGTGRERFVPARRLLDMLASGASFHASAKS